MDVITIQGEGKREGEKTNEGMMQEWGGRETERTQRSYDLSLEGRSRSRTGHAGRENRQMRAMFNTAELKGISRTHALLIRKGARACEGCTYFVFPCTHSHVHMLTVLHKYIHSLSLV